VTAVGLVAFALGGMVGGDLGVHITIILMIGEREMGNSFLVGIDTNVEDWRSIA